MPLYEYRCPHCTTTERPTFELMLPMGAAPAVATCPVCAGESRRRMSAPNLAQTGSAAFRLLDSTHRSAHEPTVVKSQLPGARPDTTQRITANPLHQKLPRP